MSDTLFDISLAVARALGGAKEGTATGGSTTTIVDATRRTETDDYWNQGGYWIVYDAGAAGAAPEKEFGTITDFANSTGTLTIETVSAAVAASDRYLVTTRRFSLDVIIAAINDALNEIYIPVWDKTSLDTVANQTEYTLPTGVFTGNLLQVWYQTNTGDANDNKPEQIFDWWVEAAAAGTGDQLHLPQLTASRDIWLRYKDRHGALNISTDKLHEAVKPERVKWHACVNVMNQLMDQNDPRKFVAGQMNRFMDLAAQAERDFPVWLPPKRTRWPIYRQRETSYTGEVGSVRLGG